MMIKTCLSYTVVPLDKATPSTMMKSPYKRGALSLGGNLVVFYYPVHSRPHLKRGVAFGGSDFIRGGTTADIIKRKRSGLWWE